MQRSRAGDEFEILAFSASIDKLRPFTVKHFMAIRADGTQVATNINPMLLSIHRKRALVVNCGLILSLISP